MLTKKSLIIIDNSSLTRNRGKANARKKSSPLTEAVNRCIDPTGSKRLGKTRRYLTHLTAWLASLSLRSCTGRPGTMKSEQLEDRVTYNDYSNGL